MNILINTYSLLNSKRFFSEYAKLSDEAEFINKEGYTQEKYEDIYMNEVKAFLTNMEQVYQSNPNHIPTIEVLKEDLIGFEGKSEFTQNRIQQILLNASWVSLR